MAGFGSGYVVMVGCHNTHRVTALQAVGGFAAHDADDLLTALMYLAEGWRGVYVPETLAIGLTPVSWSSYLMQQRRWARSVFDLKLRVLPGLRPRLRPAVWWQAMAQGVSYIGEAVLPLAGVAALCTVLLTGHATLLSRLTEWPAVLLLVSLAAIDIFRQRFYVNAAHERGLHWRAAILRQAKWPAVALGLFDAVRRRVFPYVITAKRGATAADWRPFGPHAALAAVVLLAYAYAWRSGTLGHWSLTAWALAFVMAPVALLWSARTMTAPAFDARLFDDGRRRLTDARAAGDTNGQQIS